MADTERLIPPEHRGPNFDMTGVPAPFESPTQTKGEPPAEGANFQWHTPDLAAALDASAQARPSRRERREKRLKTNAPDFDFADHLLGKRPPKKGIKETVSHDEGVAEENHVWDGIEPATTRPVFSGDHSQPQGGVKIPELKTTK